MNNFHLSVPCKDLKATEKFYSEILKCEIGRKSSRCIDINLYSHQLTFTAMEDYFMKPRFYSFDHVKLPGFHFGIILSNNYWEEFYHKLKDDLHFVLHDKTFLKGKSGEHQSFMITDPNGYHVEFKTFKSDFEVFLSDDFGE